MEMPEGWKRRKEITQEFKKSPDRCFTSNCDHYEFLLDLMKEMAEALEEIKDPANTMSGYGCNCRAAELAEEAIKKFKEWK